MIFYDKERERSIRNKVQITGMITVHNGCTYIRSKRMSGSVDTLEIRSDKVLGYAGKNVYVEGEVRQRKIDGHSRMYIYANSISEHRCKERINRVWLMGELCNSPSYRKTPKGREIADILIVNTGRKRKPYFLNCVAWGINARRAMILQHMDEIAIVGRMQSREYGHGKVAYEVSIEELHVC